MGRTLDLAIELIRRPSVTPDDGGCLLFLREIFVGAGFRFEEYDFDDVKNMLVWHGHDGPFVLFNGHCDVVPPGNLELWTSPPFEPVKKGDLLYGRGSADMKGPLAAMCHALLSFVEKNPQHPGRVGLLVTSDEEGIGINGTRAALAQMLADGDKPDYVIVGEPTSEEVCGDTIKIGRRGSVSGKMTVHGVQGHVAYPHLADNPVHKLAPFLTELVATQWDQGDAHFPPTTCQISNIHAGTGAVNVIPGSVTVDFNLRHGTASPSAHLISLIEAMASKHGLQYEVTWNASALPFVTTNPELVLAMTEAVQEHTGQKPTAGTGGGTSDARFFAAAGLPVVEFGPLNKTIHTIDENVSVSDLDTCALVYRAMLEKLTSGVFAAS